MFLLNLFWVDLMVELGLLGRRWLWEDGLRLVVLWVRLCLFFWRWMMDFGLVICRCWWMWLLLWNGSLFLLGLVFWCKGSLWSFLKIRSRRWSCLWRLFCMLGLWMLLSILFLRLSCCWSCFVVNCIFGFVLILWVGCVVLWVGVLVVIFGDVGRRFGG